MRSKLLYLVVGAVIVICLAAALLFFLFPEEEPQEDLTLSNYPNLFEKEVVIVIGENATEIEYESAEALAENLHNTTGTMPVLITDTELVEKDKVEYNLIIVGSPGSNQVLEEVYAETNATRVTEEYPGENKGVLEILRNPWNEEKAMLLVEGSDEWGVKAGSKILVGDKVNKLTQTTTIVEFEPLTEEEMKKIIQERTREILKKDYDLKIEKLNVSLIENHQIYRVFPVPTVTPGIAIATVAIGYDGEFFVLPKDFNKIIRRESLLLNNEDTLQLSEFYVSLQEESEYDVLILQNTSYIPRICFKDAKEPTEYKNIVFPPYVQKKDGRYYVELYSWGELGGELVKWTFLIEKNGEISSIEKYTIAESVGCYVAVY